MKPAKRLWRIVDYINRHPLAGRHRMLGYYRFCRWQVVSRLQRRAHAVRFTEKSRLWVRKGMTGATGNVYTGLHDFAEMAFLLHFLRPGDLFVDAGANVGSYTVLASAHVGCRSVAFEPVPGTFRVLEENLRLNGIAGRVEARQAAVGAQAGRLRITAALDTVNHVVREPGAGPDGTIEVPVLTVDGSLAGAVPALVKLDVEGFEWEVLQGMRETIADRRLKALIVELNGSGERYGCTDRQIHQWLTDRGFRPFAYNPFHRELTEISSHGPYNTLYLRDPAGVNERLATGPRVRVFRETF